MSKATSLSRSQKWKIIGLVGLIVLSACYILPSFVSSAALPPGFAKFFPKKLVLGTDLRGGAHIVYSIDLNKAVDDKGYEIRRELEEKLRERGIEGSVSVRPKPAGALRITPTSPVDLTKIDAAFYSDFGEVITLRDCGQGEDESSCIRVASDYADGIRESALQQALQTVRDRIDALGVAGPTVIRKENDIIVELPGFDDDGIETVKDTIARTAKLEFKEVVEDSAIMKGLFSRVNAISQSEEEPTDALGKFVKDYGIRAQSTSWTHDESGNQFFNYFLTAENKLEENLSRQEAKDWGCYNPESKDEVECNLQGRVVLAKFMALAATATPAVVVDDDHQVAYEYVSRIWWQTEENNTKPYWRTHYVKRSVEITGSSVTDAATVINPQTNAPEVSLTFNRYGARRFGELTTRLVGKKMAIILDDKVSSAPTIQVPILSGRSSITTGASGKVAQAEADELVAVLKTGSLPAPLKQESESKVGPLLGRDAVAKAKVSFLMGAALVLIMMCWYYRTSGVISMLALAMNLTFMLAILIGFGATLTLPGIAALVLTVGMAVDANIIIYERIREELRDGKSVRGSVDAGFKHGFSAILDGQATTAVAAYVLVQYGSGPIKGFAVMLLIGIACTLFTAYGCTKLFFSYYTSRKSDLVIGI